ncbi:hypothetical protein [Methyloceanibacter sp. wino2]|uniref:hypothetical protein n=1 Tax=Methyloceanibacter sp. wino2 TaxID=2170729 RepID=UPI000D3E4D80|nr:hypothetical protein [Methyloceanibacter sp. wino2]
MPKLLLHIGHGKTGSSYIQSSLARSIEVLKANQIDYPEPRDLDAAIAGRITSGNGFILPKLINDPSFQPSGDCLFSSEFIFEYLFDDKFVANLRKFLQSRSAELKVLMFIRDPISFVCSGYQQSVKRSGLTKSLPEFLNDSEYPKRVNKVIDILQTFVSIDLTISNYSSGSSPISVVEDWLGVPLGSLLAPPIANVNRSLTYGELEIQRQLNLHGGAMAGLLADAFCELVPDVQPDSIRPPLSEQEQFWDRMAPEISKLNARVEPSEQYVRDRDVLRATQPPTQVYSFSKEQLAVIVRILALKVDALAAQQSQYDALRTKHDALQAKYDELRAKVQSLHKSLSWKLTAPLRAVRSRLSPMKDV